MPEPQVTNLALVRIVRDLERVKSEAKRIELPALAYLVDMALKEARARQGGSGKRRPPQSED